MTKQVLFVQGGGEGAHEVDARLVANLRKELGPGFEIRYPAMPNEASPDYTAWKQRLAEEVAEMGDGAILVGHSVGAPILLRFLAERELRQRVAGIFLIAAPFVGDDGWQMEGSELPKDIGAKLPSGAPIFLYHGREDETVPFTHVGLYARALPRA